MAVAVGIDLGTTNSVIAATVAGQPTVIPNAEGSRTTPSVVGFTPQGERLVGQLARRQAILNPKGTIYSAKRFIGRRYDEVTSELNAVSFDVVSGPDGAVRFQIQGRQYAPEEISALVLRKLAEELRRVLDQLAQHQRGDFLRRVLPALDLEPHRAVGPGDHVERHRVQLAGHLVVAPPDEPLGGVDRPLRVQDRLPPGELADQALALRGERHHRGRGP